MRPDLRQRLLQRGRPVCRGHGRRRLRCGRHILSGLLDDGADVSVAGVRRASRGASVRNGDADRADDGPDFTRAHAGTDVRSVGVLEPVHSLLRAVLQRRSNVRVRAALPSRQLQLTRRRRLFGDDPGSSGPAAPCHDDDGLNAYPSPSSTDEETIDACARAASVGSVMGRLA